MRKRILVTFCLFSLLTTWALGQTASPAKSQAGTPGRTRPKPAAKPDQPSEPAMTNDDVAKMVVAGLSDAIIANSIKLAKVRQFDLSPAGLIKLKSDGVPDSIVAIMQDPSAPLPEPKPQVVQAPAPAPPAPKVEELPQQPYVMVLTPSRTSVLKKASVQIAATKAKGDDLASVAMNDAITGALPDAGAVALGNVAGSMAVAGMGTAAVPFVGGAASAMTSLLGRRKAQQKTNYVWALPGQASKTVLPARQTSFEIVFGDIPGVDPDEFEPALIKVQPTKNNWRLVGASEGVMDVNLAAGGAIDLYSHFVENRTTFAKLTKLGRGQVRIEMDDQITPGEYALVLRPIAKDKKFSEAAIASNQREGLVFNSAWDFSLAPANVAPTGEITH